MLDVVEERLQCAVRSLSRYHEYSFFAHSLLQWKLLLGRCAVHPVRRPFYVYHHNLSVPMRAHARKAPPLISSKKSVPSVKSVVQLLRVRGSLRNPSTHRAHFSHHTKSPRQIPT